MVDPGLVQNCEVFTGEEFPERRAVEELVRRLVATPSRAEFGRLQGRLAAVVRGAGPRELRTGHSLQQFCEALMEASPFVCVSQIPVLLGACELFFSEHEGLREQALQELREELISQSAEAYAAVAHNYPQHPFTAPLLLYLALAVAARATQTQAN